MPSLTSEAEQVLHYLVINHTPESLVAFDELEQNTNLHGAVLSDALSELDEYSLITIERRLVRPKTRAWEVAGEDVAGFDVREDALKLAHAVNNAQSGDEHIWIEAQQLERATKLTVKQLNVAALWLRDDNRLNLIQPFGTRPYAFASAQGTYRMRKWLQDQQGQFRDHLPTTSDISISHTTVDGKRQPASPATGQGCSDAKPKVFVSHSSKDVTFASKLVEHLKVAGAEAWMDVNDLGAGNFQQRIDDALADCEWFLLVLTRNALTSNWVRQEVYAANRLKNQGKVRELIFIKAADVEYSALPPTWGVFNIFDATVDYQGALKKTLTALGLASIVNDPPSQKISGQMHERHPLVLNQAVYAEGELPLEIQHITSQRIPADLIATALGWVNQFADIGVPDDLTSEDAELATRIVRHSAMESTGPLVWSEPEWIVMFRGTWKVALDTLGIPKGPPEKLG